MTDMSENPYPQLTERQYRIKEFIEFQKSIDPLPTIQELQELQPLAFQISDRFGHGCHPNQHNIDSKAEVMRLKISQPELFKR